MTLLKKSTHNGYDVFLTSMKNYFYITVRITGTCEQTHQYQTGIFLEAQKVYEKVCKNFDNRVKK